MFRNPYKFPTQIRDTEHNNGIKIQTGHTNFTSKANAVLLFVLVFAVQLINSTNTKI